MRALTDLRPTELDELSAAPFRFAATAQLDADPDAVFAELGDPSLWFPMMTRSVWKTGATSGVGAEREVDVRLFGRFRERMLVWEPGRRMAYTMLATTSPLVTRMAEDWQLGPSAGGTRLDWIVAATPTVAGRAATPALRAILHVLFAQARRGLGKRAGSYARHHGKQVS